MGLSELLSDQKSQTWPCPISSMIGRVYRAYSSMKNLMLLASLNIVADMDGEATSSRHAVKVLKSSWQKPLAVFPDKGGLCSEIFANVKASWRTAG